MRKPRTKKFCPTGLDTLEDRTVMSVGGVGTLAPAAQVAPVTAAQPGSYNNGNITSVTYALENIDLQFAQFANNFRQAEAAYFSALGSSGTTANSGAYATYQSTVKSLADNLSNGITAVTGEIPAGGLLTTFIQARLMSTYSGSLSDSLASIPPIGTTDLQQNGFAYIARTQMSDALSDVQDMVRMYDASLFDIGQGFQSGQIRRVNFQSPQYAGLSGAPTGAATTPVVDSVLAQVYNKYGDFANTYRTALVDYFNSVDNGTNGTGDIQSFYNTVGTAAQNLAQQTMQIINAVPGGGGELTYYVTQRIGGLNNGSLYADMTSLPPVGTSGGVTKAAFYIAAQDSLQNAILSTQSLTRLYDNALRYGAAGASNLMSQYATSGINTTRGRGGIAYNSGRAGTSLGTGTPTVTAAAVSSPTGAGTVQAQQYYGGLYNSYYGFGGYPYSYYSGFYGGGLGGLSGYPYYGGSSYPYGYLGYGYNTTNGLGLGFGGYYY